MHTVALQVRRLQSTEPEDEVFIFRKWADFDLLAVGLVRLKRCAELACELPEARLSLSETIEEFDTKLPSLMRVRNVAEHIDDYALERGHDNTVSRFSLEVSQFESDGPALSWHGGYLHAETALSAAEQLFLRMQVVRNELKKAP